MHSYLAWARPLARSVATVALSSSLLLGVLALTPGPVSAGTSTSASKSSQKSSSGSKATPAPAGQARPLPPNAIAVDSEVVAAQLQAIEDQLVLIQKELESQPTVQKKVQRRIDAATQAIGVISLQLQNGALPPPPAGVQLGASAGPMGGSVGAGVAVGPNGGMVSAGGMAGPMGAGVSGGMAVGPNGAVVSVGTVGGPAGAGVSAGVVNPPGAGAVVVVDPNRPLPPNSRPAVVVVQASPPAGTVPVAPPPGNPPPMEVRRAIEESELASVLAAIDDESFSQGKLNVLSSVASSRWFTVDQLKRIVGKMTFDQDKIKSVEIVAPRLLDKENGYKLYSAFDFQTSKDKVAEILKR